MWLDVLLLCTTHPHSALWPSRRQPRCWGRRQQGGLHSAVQTVLSIYLLERVSMAKANLHQQEMQFHPRAARLSSSSLHKGAPSLCISLPKKWNSPSPLACPCTQLMLQTVCFFPQESSLALVTAHEAESCKMVQGALLIWGFVLRYCDSISTLSVLLVAMGYLKSYFWKCKREQLYFCHFLTLNIWIQLSVGGGQASFLKRRRLKS